MGSNVASWLVGSLLWPTCSNYFEPMQCLGGSLLWQEVLALADHFLFKKCVWKKKSGKYIACLSFPKESVRLWNPYILKNSFSTNFRVHAANFSRANSIFLFLFLSLSLFLFLSFPFFFSVSFSFPYYTFSTHTFSKKLKVEKVTQSTCWTPFTTITYKYYKYHKFIGKQILIRVQLSPIDIFT